MSQKKKAYVEPAYSTSAPGAARADIHKVAGTEGERQARKPRPVDTQHKPPEVGTSREPGRDHAGRDYDVLPGILGKQLRTAYGELLNVPVPDRFTDLIKQLEHQEAEKAAPPKPREKEGGK